MSVLAWIVLGVASGLVACSAVHRAGLGFAIDVVLAVSGCAAVGVLACRYVEGLDVTPFHIAGLFASMTSAAIVLAGHYALAPDRLRNALARSGGRSLPIKP